MSGLEEIVSSLRKKKMERLLITEEKAVGPIRYKETGQSPKMKSDPGSIKPMNTMEASCRETKGPRSFKRGTKGDERETKLSRGKRKNPKTMTWAMEAANKQKRRRPNTGEIEDVEMVDPAGLFEHISSLPGSAYSKVSHPFSDYFNHNDHEELSKLPLINALDNQACSHPSEGKLSGEIRNRSAFHCSCRGMPCFTKFDAAQVASLRHQFKSLSREELDICLAAKIEDGIHLENVTRKAKKSAQTERKASRTEYWLYGHSICRGFFKFVHSVGQDKLTSVMKHYKKAGIEARVHKNKNRRPSHALQERDKQYVVDFIKGYMNTYAVPSSESGMAVGSCDTNSLLGEEKLATVLPKSCTKLKVYQLYREFALDSGFRIPLISTFRRIWRESFPT